jgi:hypothetical protein
VCVCVCVFIFMAPPWWARDSLTVEVSISHSDTPHIQDSGRVISPTHRALPDNTKHSQETDILSPESVGRGFRTPKPSKRTAEDHAAIGLAVLRITSIYCVTTLIGRLFGSLGFLYGC